MQNGFQQLPNGFHENANFSSISTTIQEKYTNYENLPMQQPSPPKISNGCCQSLSSDGMNSSSNLPELTDSHMINLMDQFSPVIIFL